MSSPRLRNRLPARTKVLYMHGLESGPRGRKVERLSRNFDVHAVDMGGILRRGRSSTNPDTLVLVQALVAGLFLTLYLARYSTAFNSAMTLFGTVVVSVGLYKMIVSKVVYACLRAQVEAIESFAPDIVVGSSFGGALGVMAIGEGHWNGPTLLLCPAHKLVSRYMLSLAPSIPPGFDHRVLVCHGDQDKIVPLAHSQELVGACGTKVSLKIVKDGDHRLSTLSKELEHMVIDVLDADRRLEKINYDSDE